MTRQPLGFATCALLAAGFLSGAMAPFGGAEPYDDWNLTPAEQRFLAEADQYLQRPRTTDVVLLKLGYQAYQVRRSGGSTDAAKDALWWTLYDMGMQRSNAEVGSVFLDHDLPWTRMRQVYRLLGLVKRYGAAPVATACGRALELDVVSVTKIAAMLEKATENTPAEPPRAASGLAPARFARDAREYRTAASRPKPDWMTVIDGGALDNAQPQQQEDRLW